jgi:hypothetical protein
VPAIIGSSAQQDIAAVARESIGKEFSRSGNIEFLRGIVSNISRQFSKKWAYRILAVSAWSATTFFTGDLHQTLLSTPTNGLRIATTLLHSEGNQDDGRNVILAAVLLKDPKKLGASFERAGRGLESRGQ